MNTEIKSFSMIAPALYHVPGSKWAWVQLADLSQLCNMAISELWQAYVSEAREAILQETWNGVNWKHALLKLNKVGSDSEVSGRGFYTIMAATQPRDVWDMKTGECVKISAEEMKDLAVPAGWSRVKLKESAQLEESLRFVLSDRNRGTEQDREKCKQSVKKALLALDTYRNLEFALKQIEAGPDSLKIDTNDLPETSEFLFTAKAGLDAVTARIRLRLGKLQVEEVYFGRQRSCGE